MYLFYLKFHFFKSVPRGEIAMYSVYVRNFIGTSNFVPLEDITMVMGSTNFVDIEIL